MMTFGSPKSYGRYALVMRDMTERYSAAARFSPECAWVM